MHLETYEIKYGRKTEIEKIADEVVTQDMLDKYIDFSKPERERYIPDKRLPVYDFLKKMHDEKKKSYTGKELTWNFIDEAGKEFEIKIVQNKEIGNEYNHTYIILTSIQGKNSIKKREVDNFEEAPITIMQFAEFLGIEEQMKQIMGNHYKNVDTDNSGHISASLKKGKTCEKLIVRLSRAMEEYFETQFEFYATEGTRKQNAQSEVSKRRSFTEQLRTLETPKALETPESKEQTVKQSIEDEKPKKEGTQIGG